MTGGTIIIGGGLAGAAVAAVLADAGRPVTLFERESSAGDKVCGEFLSVGAVASLRRLEIDPVALGAVAIERVRLVWPGGESERALPFAALSLSRRILDPAVRQRAADAGAAIRMGIAVSALDREAAGWRVGLAGGNTIDAREVVAATGKHDLRGWRRPRGVQNDLVGLKRQFLAPPSLARALAGTCELILFPGGYAGLQPVEHGGVNLCLVVRRGQFDSTGGTDAALDRLIRRTPALAARLGDAAPLASRTLAIANIPYGLVRRRSEGLWHVGDQAAVVPSFTGAGMEMALHGALLAGRMLCEGADPRQFQTAFARRVIWQVRLATLVSLLMVGTTAACSAARVVAQVPQLMALLAAATRVRPEVTRC